MKLIYIEWEDAHSINIDGGWNNLNELDEFIEKDNGKVKQVGWIYQEEKNYIVILSQIGVDHNGTIEEVGMIQKIPKTWIHKRVDLTKYIK